MYELYRRMPYGVELDDTVMVLRDGSVCAAWEVTGIDSDTSDTSDVLSLRASIAGLLNGLDDGYTFYVHRFRRDVQVTGFTKPAQAFARAVDDTWFDRLNDSSPKESVIVLTIVRTPTATVRLPLIGRAIAKARRRDTADLAASLREAGAVFAGALPVTMTPLTIGDGAFGAAMAVLNFQPYAPIRRGHLTLVAQDVSDVTLEFGRDGIIEIDDGAAYGMVLSVKEMPVTTVPGALDALSALDDVVVSQSFGTVHRDDIVEQATLRIDQMRASSDLAQLVQQQLTDTINRIEAGQLGVGEYRLTILLWADTPDALEQRLESVASVCQRAKLKMVRERSAPALEMLACHPGNLGMTSRSSFVSTETFSDLSSLHGSDVGVGVGEVPWVEPITVLETERGTPHRFSLHPPGRPDKEPTNGHTLVLGPSDAGKTTTTLFLATQALRLGARVIAFDKDRAMEMAIRANGGTYASVKVGVPTGLNPLRTETGERGEAWLMDWWSALLETTGAPLTPKQSKALRAAIVQNGAAPDQLQTFAHFETLIGDADDDNDLALRVREWGPRGRYSWVFGESDDTLVDFASNDVTALDLTEVLGAGTERMAILAYLFRAIGVVMEEKRPMVLIVDEAWRVLDDPYFAEKMKEWLVTARKMNVVVMLLTQFPSHIRRSAASSVLESLPNRLIFPNAKAGEEDYTGMNLTDGELSFLLDTTQGGYRALHSTDRGSTILDVDLSRLGPLLTALGGGSSGDARFGSDYRDRPDFWRGGDPVPGPSPAGIRNLERAANG